MKHQRHGLQATLGAGRSRTESAPGRALPATIEGRQSAGDSESWCDLGRDSLLQGEVAEALWFLRKAVEADGDNPFAWQLLGRCFEEMGEERRARNCYGLASRQLLKMGVEQEPASVGSLMPFWRGRLPRDA